MLCSPCAFLLLLGQQLGLTPYISLSEHAVMERTHSCPFSQGLYLLASFKIFSSFLLCGHGTLDGVFWDSCLLFVIISGSFQTTTRISLTVLPSPTIPSIHITFLSLYPTFFLLLMWVGISTQASFFVDCIWLTKKSIKSILFLTVILALASVCQSFHNLNRLLLYLGMLVNFLLDPFTC